MNCSLGRLLVSALCGALLVDCQSHNYPDQGGLFGNITYTATTVQLQNLLVIEGDTDGGE